MKASDTLNVQCRRCAGGPAKCILPSPRGAYLRCEACGYMWQEDGLLLTRAASADPRPSRRRADRLADGFGDPASDDRTFQSHEPCPRCGRLPDDDQQRLMRRLLDRIAHLEDENQLLRESARGFGELAERLSERVREERDDAR